MDPNNINGVPLPDGSGSNPAGGAPAVGTVPPNGGTPPAAPETMTLDELNKFLGKDFKSKDSALKSVKETFSFVGKRKEDIEAEVRLSIATNDKTDELSKQLQAMEDDRFYDKNPNLDSPEIRKFISTTGKRPQEVVAMPEFKAIFDKVTEYDKTQKLKTVLESNPRLSSSRDNLKKAQDLQAKPVGSVQEAGRVQAEAGALAVDAVKQAFDL